MKSLTIEDRILSLRENSKLSQEEFGEKIGVTKSTISLIERKLRNPSDRLIRDICREFNINEEWLRTGKGDREVPLNRRQQIAQLTADLFKGEKDSFKERLLLALTKLDEDEWKVLEKIATDLTKEKD